MRFWLLKSDADCFSIDDLQRCPEQTDCWDGVRNYQARNFIRDDMAVGDQAFFYHSKCPEPGIAGIVEIVSSSYPDHTAFDITADHFDAKSTPENPLWYMVDCRFMTKFPQLVTLATLKATPALANMLVCRRGNRLSITPVTTAHWQVVLELAGVA